MVIGVFSRKMREGVDPEVYQACDDQMWGIVSGTAEYGLVGVSEFATPEGVKLTLALFETAEGMRAWRNDVEHRVAQQRGRDEFFEWYWGLSATVDKGYEFDVPQGRRAVDLSTWLPPGFEPPER
jgi:hypothetical protein